MAIKFKNKNFNNPAALIGRIIFILVIMGIYYYLSVTYKINERYNHINEVIYATLSFGVIYLMIPLILIIKNSSTTVVLKDSQAVVSHLLWQQHIKINDISFITLKKDAMKKFFPIRMYYNQRKKYVDLDLEKVEEFIKLIKERNPNVKIDMKFNFK